MVLTSPRRLSRRSALVALLFVLVAGAALSASFAFLAAPADAHRDGCHRWHSCPSDTGSYVCGDLGYDTYCPGATTPPPATPAPVVIAVDRNCPDFGSYAEAQAYFLGKGGPSLDPDALDADHDGVACETLPGAPPQPTCSNERDDDGDGLPDTVDPDCRGDGQGFSESPGACNDLQDDDGDRLVDRADPTCIESLGLSESGGDDAACSAARIALAAREKSVRTLRAKGYSIAKAKPKRKLWREAQRRLRAARASVVGSCPEDV